MYVRVDRQARRIGGLHHPQLAEGLAARCFDHDVRAMEAEGRPLARPQHESGHC